MEGAVHVGIGHSTEEFGLLLSQLSGRDGVEGHFGCRWGIRLENAILLPFLLVLLLDDDQGIALLGLVGVSRCD